MLNKYRLFQRTNGFFYWQDNESCGQGSLRTKDRKTAKAAARETRGASLADPESHDGARLSFRARLEDEHAHMNGRHARDGHARSAIQSGALRACLLLHDEADLGIDSARTITSRGRDWQLRRHPRQGESAVSSKIATGRARTGATAAHTRSKM